MNCRPALLAGLLIAFSVATLPARAQGLDDAFRKDIERLLDVSGSSKAGVQMASLASGQILDGLAKQRRDIPPEAIALAKSVLNEEFEKAFAEPGGLNSQIVLVYAKHFTHEDVRGLLAFYETTLGKKMLSVTPALMQEAAVVGQSWAEQNMARIAGVVEQRLRAEGFIK